MSQASIFGISSDKILPRHETQGMFHLGIKTNVLTLTCISILSICIYIWILVQIIPKLRADPINIRLCWWARRSRADLNIYSTLPHTQTSPSYTQVVHIRYILYSIHDIQILRTSLRISAHHTIHIIFTKRPHTQTCITPAHTYMGQFLQDGENSCFVSFFFLKVEPPCDQT